jgi:inner membrane protein involved in colicin E2 resistance
MMKLFVFSIGDMVGAVMLLIVLLLLLAAVIENRIRRR